MWFNRLLTAILMGLAVLALPLQPALAATSVGPNWQSPGTYTIGNGNVVINTQAENYGPQWSANGYSSLAEVGAANRGAPPFPPLPAGYVQASQYWQIYGGGLEATAPGAPITGISITYQLPVGVTNPERLSIWEAYYTTTLSMQSIWIWLPLGGTQGGGMVTTTLDMQGRFFNGLRKPGTQFASGSVFVALASPAQYTDLQGYTWAKNAIDAVGASNIMHGVGNGQFDPGGTVTRAQAAAVFLAAVGGGPTDSNPVDSYGVPSVVATGGPFDLIDQYACPPPAGTNTPPGTPIENANGVVTGYIPSCEHTNWTPLPANAWYTPYVQATVADHVMAGVGTIVATKGLGTIVFDPNASMTRAQAAVVLMQVYGMDTGNALPTPTPLTFADKAAIPSWAANAVGEAAGLGIVTGDPNGNFDPNAPVTRAELAVMVAKMMALPGVGIR